MGIPLIRVSSIVLLFYVVALVVVVVVVALVVGDVVLVLVIVLVLVAAWGFLGPILLGATAARTPPRGHRGRQEGGEIQQQIPIRKHIGAPRRCRISKRHRRPSAKSQWYEL